VLDLQDVRKHFAGSDGSPIRAVDGVTLTLAAGELIALYGPSGSGKSTLLMLAAGIVRPDAGCVVYRGQDLAALSRGALARHRRTQLGFVFQSFHLAPGLSAIDNAAFKLVAGGMSRREARRRAAPLLDRLGVSAHADQRVAKLSRGERQRVAVARALANDPSLLLADEPTGSLDSCASQSVLSLLTGVCRERGVGVLLATHDPAGAEVADRVCTLHDGALSQPATVPR